MFYLKKLIASQKFLGWVCRTGRSVKRREKNPALEHPF
jgi:hypothetical protein